MTSPTIQVASLTNATWTPRGPCCFRGLDMDPVDGLVPGFHTEVDPFQRPGAFSLARFLHQNGFSHPLQRDSAGWSPLCFAAMKGSPALVQELLDSKASPNESLAMHV